MAHSRYLLLPLLLAAACTARPLEINGDDPRPRWHRQFTVKFNETESFGPLFVWHTNGTWWYDAELKAEAVYRENGRGDRYCKSIHALTSTPCLHVVTSDGNRYIKFPDLKECCKCCDSSKGCGTLSPGWLDDAEYQGKQELMGLQVYKFAKKGLQPNYLYTTADHRQLPVELDQLPNDYQTFDLNSWQEGPPDPSVFEVPEFCEQRCPITSLCTVATAVQ